MTPGALARRILGSRFNAVGEIYRGWFVDMDRVVDVIEPALPEGAHCLDVGAGDGLVSNMLLRRRSDLRFTLIDIAPSVGGFIGPEFDQRVVKRPATPIAQLAAEGFTCDAILMTDVLHHVPVEARNAFFGDLQNLCVVAGCRLIVIKDLEPEGARSWLAVLSDKYVTGDKHVSLISREALRSWVAKVFGEVHSFETSFPDHPNYCAVIRLPEPA